MFRGSDRVPTRLIKVKFQGTYHPEHIYCLGERYPVSEYFPPVKRCFKCFKYSHYTTECNDPSPKCGICNQSHRENEICNNLPHCAHCGSGHSTNDPNCPKFLKEKEIVAISYEKNIGFKEARGQVEQGVISYASTLKKIRYK